MPWREQENACFDLRYAEVNGVRLAYEDVGEGPTILFVHGFMLDRTMWRGQVAALNGWRRIAPDLRGHVLSEAPDRTLTTSRRCSTLWVSDGQCFVG